MAIVVFVGTFALVAMLVVVGLVLRTGTKSDEPSAAPTQSPVTEGTPAKLAKFYTQKLTWKACGSGAQCTTISVPIDYAKPDGATLSLHAKYYAATGKSSKVLFVNPGGPGAPASDFADHMKDQLPSDVRAVYGVIGVDPRGTGESTPVECLSDKQFDAYTASDPDPDTSAEATEYNDATVAMGDACEAHSGELAAHISTEEAARDHDIVRALLGQKQIDWFGASYGTQLGATYATLFPSRVGRMVLDGAVDPSLTEVQAALGQTEGFQQALDAYIANCVKASNCPQGWESVQQGDAAISQLMASLDAKPLPGNNDRELTQGLAFYGIALPLYASDLWPNLTEALTAAFKGNGQPLITLSDYYFSRDANGHYADNSGQAIAAISCLDEAQRGSGPTAEQLLPEFEAASPVFGQAMAWSATSCENWPIPATSPQQAVHAQGANTIVVVGTTRDPATPYAWAKSLRDQLGSAVLLSRDGDGHTGYGMGNDCVDKKINNYLLTGKAPKDNTMCAA
jgi:pimeloyl-ACP methyl ester carboxylesterase